MSNKAEDSKFEARSSTESGSGTQNSPEQKPRVMNKPYNDDPTNLIVNYLPVYFTEDHLKELFSQYGNIESLIVMYNKHDYRKKSKGYGFVKFSNGVEAAAAIKGVDGTRIANKTIKVSVARPGRARRSSNVFISRLPVNWRDEDLQIAFKEFGHIVECRVLTFGDGVSRRCGFVRYDSDEEAKYAMLQMQNHRPSPRDAPLQVNLSVNHSPDARTNINLEKELLAMQSDYDNLPGSFRSRSEYYSNAMHRGAPRCTWDDDYLPNYGGRGTDFAAMMHDPMGNVPFGGGRDYAPPFHPDDYGYPDYSMRGPMGPGPMEKDFSMQGRPDYTSLNRNAKPYTPTKSTNTTAAVPCAGGSDVTTEVENGTRLFVQNLPEFYEESHLKQLFSSYGEITKVTIQRDRHGKSIKCGFVNFTVVDHASSALEALNGVMLSTQTLVIHVM